MPIVDITLNEGRRPETLKAIGDGVHAALVEHFGIPVDDRFQIIHQKRPGELIFDRAYLGGPRTDGFVMIRITVGAERPEPLKYALYQAIVDNLCETGHIHPEDVFISLATIALSDISVSGGRPYDPPHMIGTNHPRCSPR